MTFRPSVVAMLSVLALSAGCFAENDPSFVLDLNDAGEGDGGESGDGDGDESGDGDDGDGDGDGDGDMQPETRRLDISDKALDANLSGGIPILVKLTPSRVDYRLAGPGGTDLRFFDRDKNVLPHEIESWTDKGTSFVWVSVPEIDDNDDHLYMEYGPSDLGNSENSEAVWEDYLGVWHLGGDPIDEQRDASTNLSAGEMSGDVVSSDGVVGSGMSFDGNDVIEIADVDDLDLTDAITLEAWVRPDAEVQEWRAAVSKANAGEAAYELMPSTLGLAGSGFYARSTLSAGATSADHVPANKWTHMAGTFLEASGQSYLYIDGELAAESPLGIASMRTNDEPLMLGDGFVGELDEVRISGVAHSPEWLAVQVLSMQDELLTFGPAERN